MDIHLHNTHVYCKYSHIGSRGQSAGVVRPWGWDLCAEVHVYIYMYLARDYEV